MNGYFKKYMGGAALMLSVLFLLIGLTQYNQIITGLNNDITQSAEFIKTSVSKTSKMSRSKKLMFSLKDDGEIIKISESKDGKRTYHYRALYVPELEHNYISLPTLKTEIIAGDSKKMIPREIYKIDRDKGILYFLLKVEKDHQIVMTGIYTGVYEVELTE